MPENKGDSRLSVSLSNEGVDHLVATLRAATSGIPLPWVGSIISELITVSIPNQRIDRIADYARRLGEKSAEFEKSFLDEQAKRSDFCEMIEESFHQAARSTTEDRRQYIANLIASGLRKDKEDYLKSRFLLRILQQLNDAEILILYHYGLGYSPDAHAFANKHPALFPMWVGGGQREEPEASAIREGYSHHLADLGLLTRGYETRGGSFEDFRRTSFDPSDTEGALEAMSKSMRVELKDLEISGLGRVFLKFLLDQEGSNLASDSGQKAEGTERPPWHSTAS